MYLISAEMKMDRRLVALRLVGVGFFIGGAIVLGVGTGIWLDGKLGTSPVLAITGLLIGIIVAFFGVYQMLLPLIRNRQERKNK
jgi:F0F1-type ATP synthase assembly protein I